jgi:hypothetical protein
VSHLFWMTTLIPGFAVLQALFPHDVRRGLLATLTWSFLLTVALLTPIVVVAFLFHFPASTVAWLYLGLVVLGLIGIVRFGRWHMIVRSLKSGYWLETAIILIAVVLTLPLGGAVTDDSYVHAAKIRYMRDVGFSLQDPYSPSEVIETRYHVSVHHSLFAVAAWLTGDEPLELWFKSAWFFRLIGLGGVGFLAATLFRSRWVGALAMLGAAGIILSLPIIAYPFAMTPYVAFPLLLAHVLNVLDKPTERGYLRVLLASLSLAVLHIGYWLIVAMCLMPVVAGWMLWHVDRARLVKAMALLAGAALPGIPFLLVSALQPNYVDAQQGLDHVWMLRSIDIGSLTITILDPTHYTWMLPTVAATSLLVLVGRPTRSAQILVGGVLAASMVYMFTPFLFDLLCRIIPYWLVRRARFVGEVIAYANGAGALAWMARRTLRTRLPRMAFALTVFLGGLVIFRVSINDYFLDRQDQWRSLQNARELQEAVRDVPPRALVAANEGWSLVLPSVHLAAVMAPRLFNSNPADGGVLKRHKDAEELFAPDTTARRRREIVVEDGIDFIVTGNETDTGRPTAEAEIDFEGIGELVADRHGFRVFKVRRTPDN